MQTIEGLFNYEYIRDNPEHFDDRAWHEGRPKDIVDDIRQSLTHPERSITSAPRRRDGRRSHESSTSCARPA